MSTLRLNLIMIVGLGLIGGSLAAACRKAFPRARIVGVSRSQAALRIAKEKGWIHVGFRDLDRVFLGVGTPPHFVILCTPVDTLKAFLISLDQSAPRGTIVTDAGSVKGFLVRWADQREWNRIQWVGAHPMAGSHLQGIQAARPELFANALTFVTPGRRCSRRAVQLVTQFWKKISRRVVQISPEKHDQFTAEISHLPHLTAALLVGHVSSNALRFAASGFYDTTRIAQGDPGIWLPIFSENRKELLRLLSRFEKSLQNLKRILQKPDLARLKKILVRSQKRRQALEIR